MDLKVIIGYLLAWLMLPLPACMAGTSSGDGFPMGYSPEKILLYTDRSLYVAGEEILFGAVIYSGDFSLTKGSDVLYVELFTSSGARLAGGKYAVDKSTSAGCLNIPPNLLTGIYYLKAYTKWMRNNGPASYYYLPVKIIIPGNSAINPDTHVLEIPTDSSDIPYWKNFSEEFIISTSRAEYTRRDTVFVKLQWKENSSQVPLWTCISVVRDGALSATAPIAGKYSAANNPLPAFHPETRGPSISGRVLYQGTGNPIPLAPVKLSILGNNKDFIPVSADSSGRFAIALPTLTGQRELFIVSDFSNGNTPRVLVDNDYCPLIVQFPPVAFQLSASERAAGLDMAENIQIREHFREIGSSDSLDYSSRGYAFYGEPQVSVLFDKFVQLPVLEEYFREFLPQIQIRKQDGRKHFTFYDKITGFQVLDPLVLVDLIAVSDIDRILSLSTENISRLEIINSTYIKGDTPFGGIISIFSRKGDLAGIDLPSSGLFLNYDFYSESLKHFPQSEVIVAGSPDTRNTLFWLPSYNDQPLQQVRFQVGDTPGRYLIVIRGITSTGQLISRVQSFNVR